MSSEWINAILGDKNYFDILGSGIVSFDGIKDYLSTSSVNGSKIEYVEEEVSFRRRPSRANMQPIPNSVWFAKMKNTLKVLAADSYLCEQVILSTGYCGIHSEKVISPYLKQIILSTEFNNQKDRLAEGSTQEAINTSKVKNIQLYFPRSVHEQAKIAQVLTTVDEAIVQTEALIAKQQRIKTGLMQDVLTRGIDEHGNFRSEQTHKFKDSPLGRIPVDWEVLPCIRVCREIIVGIVIQPAHYYIPEGIPILRSANVQENIISDNNLVYMSEKDNEMLSKSKLYTGDLVTVRTGYPGTTAVVSSKYNGCNCVDLVISRPDYGIIRSGFLSMWVNSDNGKKQVLQGQGGLAQQHFNVGEMHSLLVKVPDLSEQERIENILTYQNTAIQKTTNSSIKLRSLKIALMQDLLTGRKPVTALLKDQGVVSV